MNAYGSDRVRAAGSRFIIHSPIPKGWTPRSRKTLTRPEHPGTTVSWDGAYFEVISAEGLPSGGVRYVLEAWRSELTIRTFEGYDEESEARRHADYELAMRQRRRSVAGQLAGVVLGYCPAGVQVHLANELGLRPQRMTLLSTIPPMVMLGSVLWFLADSVLRGRPFPLPLWFAYLSVMLAGESLIRFIITMSTGRPFGSLLGVAVYSMLWLIVPKRYGWPSPGGGERGYSTTFTIPPSEEVAFADALEMRGPLLALLPAAEQKELAETHGFDYLRHARPFAWIALVGSGIGAVSMIGALVDRPTATRFLSAAAAIAIAAEQIYRLWAFSRGPAGSMFGFLARPFVRDFLRSARIRHRSE